MVQKRLNHNSAFSKSLATAQKNRKKCTAKYQKPASVFEYNEPYPMIVTDITENQKGYVFHTDVFVNGKAVQKDFFFTKNPDTTFLSGFFDIIAPNSTDLSDVIGVPFEGEITKSSFDFRS